MHEGHPRKLMEEETQCAWAWAAVFFFSKFHIKCADGKKDARMIHVRKELLQMLKKFVRPKKGLPAFSLTEGRMSYAIFFPLAVPSTLPPVPLFLITRDRQLFMTMFAFSPYFSDS